MKVIDLLNKIANGEEVPKKIRIEHWCYEFEWKDYAGNYVDENENIDLMSALSCDKEELNYGIKIIEEDKKIEKIDIDKMLQTKKWKRDKKTYQTINELIDEVNKLKEE